MATPNIPIGYTHTLQPVGIRAGMANRHGLIAGATGTGKTVTLQTLAEGFARQGVPVFTADVKGDLSGLARPGTGGPRLEDRLRKLQIANFQPRPYPAIFWDLYGQRGHPVRTTLSDMGPLLLGRLLDLNDTQDFVLQLAFKIADDQGLLLLDIKDLRALLNWMGENAAALRNEYGNVAPATIGSIQRNLLSLDEAGGEQFFGEPALRLAHLMQHDFSGNGVISILDATRVVSDPRLYSTFLLWLLAELFEHMEEVGDQEKPRLVFFFDEAHLLFRDTPRALADKIEQVVRLIRSKGVGIYFVTQNPLDIPDTVLGQLGNRVQHALRAFTPMDQKAVRAAAETFRTNPALDTEQAIGEMEVGEALVSVLDDAGRPTMVERVWVTPPESRIGALTDEERREVLSRSPLAGTYDTPVDRESAYELLKKRAESKAPPAGEMRMPPAPAPTPAPGRSQPTTSWPSSPPRTGRTGQSIGEAMVKSVVRSMGSSIGRQIIRGIMGSILSGRR